MTSSNRNIFRVTGHLCGEFTGPRWIPHTKASDAELCVFFELRPNKRLNKQWWGWWFETPSRPLWRHRNELDNRPSVTITIVDMSCDFNHKSCHAMGIKQTRFERDRKVDKRFIFFHCRLHLITKIMLYVLFFIEERDISHRECHGI